MNDTNVVTATTTLKIYACDFCGQTEKQASYLIKAFNDTCICDKCVDLAVSLIKQQRARVLPITQG